MTRLWYVCPKCWCACTSLAYHDSWKPKSKEWVTAMVLRGDNVKSVLCSKCVVAGFSKALQRNKDDLRRRTKRAVF